MLLSRRLWAVLLVGVLAAGLLVGFGDGDEAVAKEPRATIGKIMIPAVAFTPTFDKWTYIKNSSSLRATGSDGGDFVAPLSFAAPEVAIRRIILFAYDNSLCHVEVSLRVSMPQIGKSVTRARLVTRDSPDNPQMVVYTLTDHRRINTALQGPHLVVHLPDPDHILYGVEVTYSY